MGSNDAVLPTVSPIPPVKISEHREFVQNFQQRIGITTEDLRKKLEFPEGVRPLDDTPIGRLLSFLTARTVEARRFCLKNWRVWAALDEAWQSSYRQVDQVILQKIMSGDTLREKDLQEQFKLWGLPDSECYYTAKQDGKEVRKIKRSAFHKVYIPVVKSVVMARASKIFNDRFSNDPMFVYDPIRHTLEDETLGEIVTRIVQEMVSQYGYRDVGRAAVLQALKYTHCLVFPVEAWHVEWDVDENGKEYPRKEGLRYSIPHPTRMAWDQAHRPSTFNTDTGCEWATYWDIKRYGDLVSNTAFYNTRDVPYGKNWWDPALSGSYFSSAYICTINKPDPCQYYQNLGSWTGNRTAECALYTESEYDSAVFVSNLFVKLDPVQWGLVDKNAAPWKNFKGQHRVWFRFVMANDDTPIYAEPLPYCPVTYNGCDTDDTFTLSSSLALDALPWQTFASNILSQFLLSVRINSKRIVTYDQNQVSADKLEELDNTQNEFEYLTWVNCDPKQSFAEQNDLRNAIVPLSLGPPMNAMEQMQCLHTMFNIMERSLRMSAQEVGTIAGHVQTAEEIRVIAGSTTNYVEYTASFTDSFIEAWKKQIWKAITEFMDEDFTVVISRVPSASVQRLHDELGFKFQNSEWSPDKVLVEGKKTKIAIEAFLSQREGQMRTNSPEIAKVIMQTLQMVMNSPLGSRLGPEWFATWMQRAARLAGISEDFTIKIPPEGTILAEMKAVGDQLGKAVKQITQGATAEVAKQVGPVLQKQGQDISETQQASLQLAKELAQLKQTLDQALAMLAPPPAPEPGPPPDPMPPPEALMPMPPPPGMMMPPPA